jgi:N-acetylglucosaminyldiphosphoundecaprenol N-acetyl-beta-D-mannosaminyltransferase
VSLHGTKRNVLGILVDAVDYDGAVARIVQAAEAGQPLSVSALAVHGVMTGVMDSSHRHRLNHLDLVVPDGQPVRYALNWLHGTGLKDRVSGPILMIHLCEVAAARGIPIFLYGSRLEVVEALRDRLRARFPSLIIVGAEPSKFRPLSASEKAETVARIRSSGARITFVGLGCPRQEVWVYEYRDALPIPILAVGAAFDMHAGYLPHAPMMMQDAGLEWLHRLWHEPRRLWRRYLYLNPLFLGHLTLQLTRLRRYDPSDTTVPVNDLSYG